MQDVTEGMNKLNELLHNAYVNKNGAICIRIGRKILNVPLQTFRELQACYDALRWFETYVTINKTVFDVCQYCGVEVECHAVGYIIGKHPWFESEDK